MYCEIRKWKDSILFTCFPAVDKEPVHAKLKEIGEKPVGVLSIFLPRPSKIECKEWKGKIACLVKPREIPTVPIICEVENGKRKCLFDMKEDRLFRTLKWICDAEKLKPGLAKFLVENGVKIEIHA